MLKILKIILYSNNLNDLDNENFIKQRSHSIPLNNLKINEKIETNNEIKEDINKNITENIIINKEADNNKDIMINEDIVNENKGIINGNNFIETQENKNQIINNNINIP